MFSDFEPFHCHKAIPCFDQPDIRGVMNLTMFVPEQWIAIGNGLVREESVRGGKNFSDILDRIPHGKDFAD